MVLRKSPVLFVLFMLLFLSSNARADLDAGWHSPKDVHQRLKSFGQSKRTSLETIGQSAGGADLKMLTINPVESHERPAILVIGNISGLAPLGTEASLRLIGEILGTDSPAAQSVRWHILPMANPDAGAAFFNKVKTQRTSNGTPVDEDRDGSFGEDPSEDLNGDGLITTMLVPDPAGQWIISEDHPLLAVKANTAEGQRGLYRKEIEGFDNDEDGLFNEDGPGGVNPNRNFPHRFEHWTNSGGRWAADQPESRAVLEFAYSHPQIAMILVLDQVNNLSQLPDMEENGKNGKYSVNDSKAADWNIKPGQSLTLEEIRVVLKENYGLYNATEGQLLSFLEEDPATDMDPADFLWWSAVGKQYQDQLKASGMTEERLPGPKSSAGSVEEWGYYQFGVPTFALDFWSLPSVAEEDTIQSDGDSEDVNNEHTLTDKQKALLQYTELVTDDTSLDDWVGLKGWQKAELPSGEIVFIGGPAPFALTAPPVSLVDSFLATPVRFLSTLPAWLPKLSFGEINFTSRGADVYELTVWLNNDGPIPYPIGQGLRTSRVPPLILTLEGAEILEGKSRTPTAQLPSQGSVRVRWLVRVSPGDKINITAEAPSLGRISKQLTVSAKEVR